MTTITAYISENKSYMNEAEVIVLEQLTQDQFDLIQTILEDIGHDTDFACEFTLTLTSETLADWDASRTKWNERGTVDCEDSYREYSNIQVLKGQRRTTVIVIDLGDKRIALN